MFSESRIGGFAKGPHSCEKERLAGSSLKKPEFQLSPEWHKAPIFDFK
jgi:hypothetical protein